MTREQVFNLIEKEREYQDKVYNPEAIGSSGLTRLQRDREVTPGLVLLSTYVRKAEESWVTNMGNSVPSLQQIAKIATIAVRILERAGDADKLLEKGLR